MTAAASPWPAALLALLLAGCDGRQDEPPVVEGVRQTGLPGHVRAGGRTSGEVMAARPAAATDRGPAGTPGIPLGAGGTTSGAALGGTALGPPSPGGSAAAPAASGATGTADAAAPVPPGPATSEAQQQAVALAASMDAVASRWRTRAQAQGWRVNPQTPVAALAGFDASATQSSPSGQPAGRLTEAGAAAPGRSEKAGTAAPSADVKQPTRPRTNPDVGANAPNAAN
jgi:colicin import membrane protein